MWRSVRGVTENNNIDEAARPLELLDHQVGERLRAVAVSDRIDGVDPPPSGRVHQQAGRVILGELGSEPTDLAQRCGSHAVVRADTQRGETPVGSRLECTVHSRLGVGTRSR
jgi:hypothetical protein